MIRLKVSFRARGLWDFIYFLHKCDIWSCDVWSSALVRRLAFWTSSCLPSASKSNPPLFLAPFGLPPASPPSQSPICHSCSLLLDFRASPCYLKVQSTALARPTTQKRRIATQSANRIPTSLILHQPIPPSKAPAISATSESGTRTYLPSGTNHFPIGLSAPVLTASTANFFPATQKNIIAASIAPSGQI